MIFNIVVGTDINPDIKPGSLLMIPRDEKDETGEIIKYLSESEEIEELVVPSNYNINGVDIGWCFTHKNTLTMEGYYLFLITIYMI